MSMTHHAASRLRRLASPHRATAESPGGRAIALLLRLGCTALLAWIGYIHLHLWLEGYRHIPTNGPLFLLDAAAGFILAAVVLAWPRPLAGLLAAGYTAATLGALLISLSVGLFGFQESISASYVTESLIIETITVLALFTWTVLATATPGGLPAARGRPPGRRTTAPPANAEQIGGVGDLSRVCPHSEPPAGRRRHPGSVSRQEG
jgi:hypothetical protein